MTALIIVDVQNDFCPGGALVVPRGDTVVPPINRIQPRYDLIVATQDWHPADHGSFAANHLGRVPGDVIEVAGLPQILWPVHCVQGTHGAEFHPDLNLDRVARVFRKGTNPRIDSYSGFFDNDHRVSTGLAEYLRERGVREVHICGLATDYCVKFTALDAARLGLDTYFVDDACRGVELQPGDAQRAIEEMRRAGVKSVLRGPLDL